LALCGEFCDIPKNRAPEQRARTRERIYNDGDLGGTAEIVGDKDHPHAEFTLLPVQQD